LLDNGIVLVGGQREFGLIESSVWSRCDTTIFIFRCGAYDYDEILGAKQQTWLILSTVCNEQGESNDW
jgi:hypothetical protein